MHRIIDYIRRQVPFFVTKKSPADYIGTYDCSIEKIEDSYISLGMTPNPVSFVSYKRGVGHESATWAYRESLFAERQYHSILFTDNEGIRVYCHEEYNWIRHPIKHLRQEDIDCVSGMRWCNDKLRDEDLQQYQL